MAERTLRAAKEIVYDGSSMCGCSTRATPRTSRRCASGSAFTISAARGGATWSSTPAPSPARPSTATTTAGCGSTRGDYDVVMFVDTDHVPLPIMAERLLGYFRDPDVAFVVGPQFYGNQDNRITRWAESAQYLFHSVIQRAGNRRGCAMLVGTNAAVRTSAIRNGYVASITEDMATSLRIHATQEPGDRQALAVGLHAGPGRGGRGAQFVDRVLRPADPLVGGHVRRHAAPGLAGGVQAPAGRDAALLPDADLLPVGRDRLDPGHRHQRVLPRLRHQQSAH